MAIEEESPTSQRPRWIGRLMSAATGLILLAGGSGAMILLLRADSAPAEALVAHTEQALPVEAIIVQPTNTPVVIAGQGQATARRRVMVAPEVSGRVIATHSALIVGGVIPKGETLFAIDSQQYEIAVREAAGQVAERETAIRRLETEWRNDEERLESLERRRRLAENQFERLKALFNEDVGTQEAIDFAEQSYIMATDESDQLANRVVLFPILIEESRNAIDTARARLDATRVQLAKTDVTAPFDARVCSYSIETGQFVQAGHQVTELVDDSTLEIHVPLDSRQAQQWLRFAEPKDDIPPATAWFADIVPVTCEVTWTEDTANHVWTGRLDRVANYDEASRTVTVVVIVDGHEASQHNGGGLPLVEGMWCHVSIPGAILENVFAVPESAVTVDNAVYCAKDGRLETRPVKIAHRAGGIAYLNSGLTAGDVVVTTRLVSPLDRTLLDVVINETNATCETPTPSGTLP